MTLLMRGNTWHLKRDVPVRYRGVETRRQIWLALRTDSQSEAKRRAGRMWDAQVARWEAVLAGDTGDADAAFLAAREVARTHGFRFIPIERVEDLPLDKLRERIDATLTQSGALDRKLVKGILGTAKAPQVTLSRALDIYWQVAAPEREEGKSPDQVRRGRNPRIKAFNNLIALLGDVPLADLTADDMLDFRAWWQAKLAKEKLTRNSANKDFGYIQSTLGVVNTMKRLGLTLPTDSLKPFSEAKEKTETRDPFSEAWIRDKLLAPGALAGLNLEARCIVLGMINTGYRASEAQDLLPEHIRLDVNVPHITIEPVGRTLKNKTSQRTIPLVGVSLEAFRACPQGFPRYAGKDSFSAAANKFLRENGLMETPAHTLYGLRHSFEDRLLDRDVDERIRRDLLGHSLAGRQRYGKGASLEKLAAVVQSVAL